MPQLRESNAVIAIVDHDPSVREGLESLLRSAGWRVEGFASAGRSGENGRGAGDPLA